MRVLARRVEACQKTEKGGTEAVDNVAQVCVTSILLLPRTFRGRRQRTRISHHGLTIHGLGVPLVFVFQDLYLLVRVHVGSGSILNKSKITHAKNPLIILQSQYDHRVPPADPTRSVHNLAARGTRSVRHWDVGRATLQMTVKDASKACHSSRFRREPNALSFFFFFHFLVVFETRRVAALLEEQLLERTKYFVESLLSIIVHQLCCQGRDLTFPTLSLEAL